MIYGLAGWEKLTIQSSWLFANGNTIVSQRPKFATSKESLTLAIFMVVIPGIFLLVPFLTQEVPWSIRSLSPENFIQILLILGGGFLIAKSKEGMRIRTEQGGIHPEDTLYVLDGNKKTFLKQKGTAEEIVTNFQNLTLEIRVERGNKTVNYRIYAIYPQGKMSLANMKSQKTAEELLANMKSRLQLS